MPKKEPGTPTTRLPLLHPEYRYPPSHNPYWTKVREYQGRIFTDNDTEAHRGEWRRLIPDVAREDRAYRSSRKLHVEIGCNAGHVVVEWAQENAADAYIGIDWKFKMIHKAAEKAVKRDLGNLLFFRAHADRIQYMFGPGEVDRLYLYFPDPWPKKAQKKNRFLNVARLREVVKLMRPDGIFHIKTDHDGYFDWMEECVRECKDIWEVVEHTRDLHKDHPDPESLEIPEVTLFERLWIKDGIKIKSMKLRPR